MVGSAEAEADVTTADRLEATRRWRGRCSRSALTSRRPCSCDIAVRSLFPVVLALGAGAILLLALGRNPFSFYGDVWQGGQRRQLGRLAGQRDPDGASAPDRHRA